MNFGVFEAGLINNKITFGQKHAVDEHGLYTAQVVINGVTKKGAGFSTFFPDNWSKQQVVDAVNEAFSLRNIKPLSGKPVNYWEGVLPSDIKIGGYLEDGKIVTAFPIK